MRIFDKIFRKKLKPKFKDENLQLFLGNDYCQIEICPSNNIEHINKSIKLINEFTEKTKIEFGFRDIFKREDLPFPTINEELRIDYFEKFMIEKGFKKEIKIQFDGDKINECSKITSNAFSLHCFNFFYDCKDEFIKNIWISNQLLTSKEHYSQILETLYELGEDCNMVLIDWNSCLLIDLTNKKQIKRYLTNYCR